MDKGKLKIKIYTDGACSKNPGEGGWASLLLIKGDNGGRETVTIKGGEKFTTNNRMELQAVIEGLDFVRRNLKEYDCTIAIYSDSSYVVNNINDGLIYTWNMNGWKTARDTDVKNRDLWEQLMKLGNVFMKCKFIKVKGHADNKYNNHVDKVAVEQSNQYKKILEAF